MNKEPTNRHSQAHRIWRREQGQLKMGGREADVVVLDDAPDGALPQDEAPKEKGVLAGVKSFFTGSKPEDKPGEKETPQSER